MFNPFKEPKPKKSITEMTKKELLEYRAMKGLYEKKRDKLFRYIAVIALVIAVFRIFYTGSLIELAKSIWLRL